MGGRRTPPTHTGESRAIYVANVAVARRVCVVHHPDVPKHIAADSSARCCLCGPAACPCLPYLRWRGDFIHYFGQVVPFFQRVGIFRQMIDAERGEHQGSPAFNPVRERERGGGTDRDRDRESLFWRNLSCLRLRPSFFS